MTIAEVIAMVDEIRPNQITKQTKTMWLSEIEHRVFDEVMSRGIDFCPLFQFQPFSYDGDDDTPLAVPDVYGDVYRAYLYSKIDLSLGEIDRYNNDVIMFQSAWQDYAAWYRRNHLPKERKYYGAVALFKPGEESRHATAVAVWGTEPKPCGRLWGIFGPAQCVRPVFPCYCCAEAARNDDDSTDDT